LPIDAGTRPWRLEQSNPAHARDLVEGIRDQWDRSVAPDLRIRSGARLLRERRGRTHIVSVIADFMTIEELVKKVLAGIRIKRRMANKKQTPFANKTLL
jgi:hypothetical protein